MYQVPVGGLEKIRKTRRRVKHILSDIGLEDCQNFLEELQNSDPGIQNSDPGNKNSDPGKKNSDPGIQNSDPGIQNSDPGIQNSDPGIQNSDPGKNNSDPGIQNSDPGIQNSDPGIQNSDPGKKNSDPGIQNSDPGIQNSDPGIQNSDPGIQNSDPGIQNSDPGLQNSEDDAFLETEWTDFTEGFNGRMRKKWIYRTEAICCRMCEYQTQNWRNFNHHLQRNHEDERKMCALSPCPLCPFVGHPKIVRRHITLFHSNAPPPPAPVPPPAPPPVLLGVKKGERYRCQKCSFRSSVLFAMEKHILLAHLGSLLSRFTSRGGVEHQAHRYYCRECAAPLQNLDHMLHHVLVTPAHQAVGWHVKPYIMENRNYIAPKPRYAPPAFASKAQQPQALSGGLLFPLANDQQAGKAPPLPPPGAPLSVAGVPGAAPSSGPFLCPPGTLLPPQASALVRLASAEAKGLLKPGSAITFRSALPPGVLPPAAPPGVLPPAALLPPGSLGPPPAVIRLAVPPSSALRQQQLAPGPLQPWPQQVLLPKAHMPRPAPLTATPKLPLNQTTPQGTVLTSQSLQDRLIPTGNSINGRPTYTLAPTALAGKEAILQPAKPRTSGYPREQAKSWVACPICDEVFPSDVFEVHAGVAHKAAAKRQESLAAKAPFLKKMPDKTVQCLVCKVLVSEKGLLEHLLHGLDCIFCPHKFTSIKKLVEHSKEHNPSQKVYCEFIRREYRLYSNDSGQLMFPYFDINTSAPKEVLGDVELNLALVTKSLDLIFLKMLPSSRHPAASSAPLAKTARTCCLFCDEDCRTPEEHQRHLREKHFVDTGVHAVLKTSAFKCVYCGGLFTGGRVTQRGIASHLLRCPRAPKAPSNAEKAPASSEKPLANGQAFLPAAPKRQPALTTPVPKPPVSQAPLFYFAQLPPPPAPAPAPAPSPKPATSLEPPQSEAEKLSKLRLEMAWKNVMEANKQEREAKAAERTARRLRQEEEKAAAVAAAAAAPPPSRPEVQSDPTVELALDPSSVEQRSVEERKDFLARYFRRRPYLARREQEELSRRLAFTKAEVSILFSNKRTKCTKAMARKKAAVLLGFNMAKLSQVKHNLLIPDVRPAGPEEAEEPVRSEQIEETEKSGSQEEPGDVGSTEEAKKSSSQPREVEDGSEEVAEETAAF